MAWRLVRFVSHRLVSDDTHLLRHFSDKFRSVSFFLRRNPFQLAPGWPLQIMLSQLVPSGASNFDVEVVHGVVTRFISRIPGTGKSRRPKLVRSLQPFNPTCFSTMTMEASPKPPPDGRYRPTVFTNSSTLLSQLSFIAESPNENDNETIELSHALRFETDCTVPVLTILKLFIEQLLLLDPKAYILSKDQKQHFVSIADLPTTPTELQKLFPATILNRRSGNRLVFRLTACGSKSFLELTQLGIVTWANRNKYRLELDTYHEDDVRDCLWIAGRNAQTSKPWLQKYLTDILSNTDLDNEEQTMVNTYRTKHNLHNHDIPPFSLYWRNRVVYNNLATSAIVLRCDATIQKFFVKFFTRANKNGTITEQKGRFIPMSVSKNNENATKKAMDGQNKYLTHTNSIPIIGLSFEALQTHIEIGDSGQATIESIIYQHCLSLEPTAKSTDLGRFNLICHKNDTDTLLEFIKNDLPIMWTLLPPTVANKYQETLQVTCPRLTAGYSGTTIGTDRSITLDDPQSISSTTDTQWTQPPNTRRPPRYVSVIYKDDSGPTYNNTTKKIPDNKSRTSSEKSQTTTQSESDISTLVSSIRDDMNREFQAHTEQISALRDEITQLRNTPNPNTASQLNLADIQAKEHTNIVQSLRQEIQELRQSLPPAPPPMQDLATLITSIVENMVPLITAAVQQGLNQEQPEPSKRSRTGATPTQFRGTDIQPTNLMNSYPESPPSRSSPHIGDPAPHPTSSPKIPTTDYTPAPRSEDMEE